MFELIKELLNLRKSIAKKKEEFNLMDIEHQKSFEQKQQEHINDYNKLCNLATERKKELEQLNNEISKKDEYIQEIETIKEEQNKLNKSLANQKKKLSNIKELYKAMENSIDKYFNNDAVENSFRISNDVINLAEELAPTILTKLHCMDCKELKKAYNDNNKLINDVLHKYEKRYTTKGNIAIYKLMVIALKSELQNILLDLKYERIDKGIENVKKTTQKYLDIAASGNQNIAGTLVKFIGEIEYLFINAIKIEYVYYEKKQQEREEQIAIREQMKQEAEERKLLEEQKKQIEREESKYKAEILKLQETISNASSSNNEIKVEELEKRIEEIQTQLDSVEDKKEEIVNLQNGKAGYVYVISNLGSFGKDVFKVGMTRRLEPQDRIDELGNASVPFSFDVHSFIFSENAVLLEKNIHNMLDEKRLNKVNLRKEYFKIDIDELEKLVNEVDPSAEFNKTMLAEEYNQSLEASKVNLIEAK